MTTKDKIFIAKMMAAFMAVLMFIFFCYYAAQPQIWWDEAILLAASKVFWIGLGLALIEWGMLVWVQRHHNKKG